MVGEKRGSFAVWEYALAWLMGGGEQVRRVRLDAGIQKMRALGLKITKYFLQLEGRGTRGDVSVVVTKWPNRMLPYVVAMKDAAIPEGLVMAREMSRSDGPDEDIGARDFDQMVRLSARRSSELSALLDAKTRSLLLPFIAQGGRVEDQTVVDSFLESNLNAAVLDQMAHIVRRLRLLPQDIPRRLLENARKERVPLVRLKTLAVLWRDALTSPEAREAVVLARQDPDGGVRFLSRVFEEKEGDGLTAEEAASVCRDEPTVLQAVRWLVSMDFPVAKDRVTQLLESLLKFGGFKARLSAAEALGRLGHRGALKDIVALGQGAGVSEKSVIVDALARLGDPQGEGYLLKQLAEGDPRLIPGIVRALGFVGTINSVAPLRAVGQGIFFGGLGRKIEEAIAKIQDRLGPVEQGGVSLFDEAGSGGGLSVSMNEGGISLHGPNRGKEGRDG